MIRYNPPKSQVWGHQVGRLTATAIVERCLGFLDSHCVVINSQPSELMIGWNDGPHAVVAEEVADDVDHTLGRPTTVNEIPDGDGRLFHQRRWPFSAEHLLFVATRFDKMAEALKTQDVVAQSSTFWMFAWRDAPAPLRPMESPGGMLGVHLSRPHRITTMFSFRDLDKYATVKAALSDLELVELSDKHLRPKVGPPAAKRRAK